MPADRGAEETDDRELDDGEDAFEVVEAANEVGAAGVDARRAADRADDKRLGLRVGVEFEERVVVEARDADDRLTVGEGAGFGAGAERGAGTGFGAGAGFDSAFAGLEGVVPREADRAFDSRPPKESASC